jgi:hypothetical protein
MSNYFHWGTTSSSTYGSNNSKGAELRPLKALLKKREEDVMKLAKKVKVEEVEEVEPILFDPKDLVL